MAKNEEQSSQLNLTVVALVALVAIVGLVALVMNAASIGKVATGTQQASAAALQDSNSAIPVNTEDMTRCINGCVVDGGASDSCVSYCTNLIVNGAEQNSQNVLGQYSQGCPGWAKPYCVK